MTQLTVTTAQQLYHTHNDPSGSFYKQNGCPIDPLYYPKQFQALCGSKQDIEIAGIIASYLAYGRRDQFIKKINVILKDIFNTDMDFNDQNADTYKRKMEEGEFTLYQFITERRYLHWNVKGNIDPIFYRMFKQSYMFLLFEKLRDIYMNYDSLEDCVNDCQEREICDTRSRRELLLAKEQPKTQPLPPFKRLAWVFDGVPMFGKFKAKRSYSVENYSTGGGGELKKINMFMRWMVRKDNNDLGLWTSIKPDELIMPLDTHVIAEAKRYGIIENGTGLRAAMKITEYFKEFWANDPVKGDFVLFGEGVDK